MSFCHLARWIVVASVVLTAGAVGAHAGDTAGRCWGDWSDAAPIVARERLKSARDIHVMARDEHGGDVVRIVLCEEEAGFVYRLVLRHPNGRIGNLTVNAGR